VIVDQILTTKLSIPTTRPELVLRPRLIDRLNQGLQRKMTLISAPAGFGKTTLASEWIAGCERPVTWRKSITNGITRMLLNSMWTSASNWRGRL
jgi:ATP/maltotriose-dependent transcriptional regulator MalT